MKVHKREKNDLDEAEKIHRSIIAYCSKVRVQNLSTKIR